MKYSFASFVDTHARKAIDSMMSDEGDGTTLKQVSSTFSGKKSPGDSSHGPQEKLFWLQLMQVTVAFAPMIVRKWLSIKSFYARPFSLTKYCCTVLIQAGSLC